MLTAQMSNEITRLQQMMARYDDAGREIFGAYAIASRLFEFDANYVPVQVNGEFVCKFTDADLVTHYGTKDDGSPVVTAQEFAQAFFGAVEIANNIPTQLADLIGKIRA